MVALGLVFVTCYLYLYESNNAEQLEIFSDVSRPCMSHSRLARDKYLFVQHHDIHSQVFSDLIERLLPIGKPLHDAKVMAFR